MMGVALLTGGALGQQQGEPPTQAEESAAELDELDELFDEGLDDLLGEDPSAGGGASGPGLRSWKGFVEARPRVYFSDRNGPKNDEQLLLRGEVELELDLGEGLSGYVRPRFFVDAVDTELNRIEPFEAYVTVEGDGFDVRAGQFVENWGIVDTYNPVDILSRRDFGTDFLDADRLGERGVRVRGLFEGGETIGEPTLALYAIPLWQETLFPTDDQRFGFGSPLTPFFDNSGFEPSGSERGFYAARFTSTLSSAPANADLQVIAARGPERTPAVVAANGGLVPAYFGAWTFGFGMRAVPNEDVAGQFLSTLTLKAEVAYKKPYRFDGSPLVKPQDYVAFVVGADRQFFDVLGSQDALTLTLEYAREEGASDPTAVFRPFRDDLVVRALWEPNDFARTSLEARSIYDLTTDEKIVEAIFERQLRSVHEDLKFTVQLQLFDPPSTGESLFDFFPDNSSLAVGLRWDL